MILLICMKNQKVLRKRKHSLTSYGKRIIHKKLKSYKNNKSRRKNWLNKRKLRKKKWKNLKLKVRKVRKVYHLQNSKTLKPKYQHLLKKKINFHKTYPLKKNINW